MNTPLIEQAITDYWGTRCQQPHPGCPCCNAWHELDMLKARAEVSQWRPIETLDRLYMQFVLVLEEGVVRVRLWHPERKAWELPEPIGKLVTSTDGCSSPTHWMPVPESDQP